MEHLLSAQETTQSLLNQDGLPPNKWRSEGFLIASKACICCGKVFTPTTRMDGNRIVASNSIKHWEAQKVCSRSCSKRLKNPMSNTESRSKMRATLKKIGHQPIRKGGNGRLLPLPQIALLHALGNGWQAELAVPTRMRHLKIGYPTCYKLDIANLEMKIGIELDGSSHNSMERKAQDLKKTDFFVSQGWSVYRISNQRALELYSTFTSVDTLLILLMKS